MVICVFGLVIPQLVVGGQLAFGTARATGPPIQEYQCPRSAIWVVASPREPWPLWREGVVQWLV